MSEDDEAEFEQTVQQWRREDTELTEETEDDDSV